MNMKHYTGLANEDRRIHQELVAMGYTDAVEAPVSQSAIAKAFNQLTDLLTWMRWKAEISVNGCRIGAPRRA
ncbi:MAG: hypothetical protein ACPHXW_04450 [Marinobacterium sp.]